MCASLDHKRHIHDIGERIGADRFVCKVPKYIQVTREVAICLTGPLIIEDMLFDRVSTIFDQYIVGTRVVEC